MKPQRMWAVVTNRGSLISIAPLKRDAIALAEKSRSRAWVFLRCAWKWRCIKVIVKEAPND